MSLCRIRAGGLTPDVIRRFLVESAEAYPSEVGAPDLGSWPNKLAKYADCICLQREDGALSSALFVYLNDEENHIGYISFICRLPGCGCCGRRMHDECVSLARERGMTMLRLEVLKENVRAFDFYRGRGYVVKADHAERGRWLLELSI